MAGTCDADGQRDNSWYNLWQTDLYVGWRPDEHQLLALDFYSSRFDGGDPGRITYKQFVNDPNFSFTPYNEDWVDRYTTILRYERDFGAAGFCRPKDGLPIRRSTRAQRQTSIQERRIHFLQVPLFSYEDIQ